MVYIACFIASVFFAWLAKRAGNKTAFILCSAFSLIIPIMLAALRDYSVGVDTINYLEMDLYWHGASGGSLTGYLKYYFQNGGREPIFAGPYAEVENQDRPGLMNRFCHRTSRKSNRIMLWAVKYCS